MKDEGWRMKKEKAVFFILPPSSFILHEILHEMRRAELSGTRSEQAGIKAGSARCRWSWLTARALMSAPVSPTPSAGSAADRQHHHLPLSGTLRVRSAALSFLRR